MASEVSFILHIICLHLAIWLRRHLFSYTYMWTMIRNIMQNCVQYYLQVQHIFFVFLKEKKCNSIQSYTRLKLITRLKLRWKDILIILNHFNVFNMFISDHWLLSPSYKQQYYMHSIDYFMGYWWTFHPNSLWMINFMIVNFIFILLILSFVFLVWIYLLLFIN